MDASYDPPAQFRTASDQLHDIVAREVGTSDFGPAGLPPRAYRHAPVDGL